MNAVVQEKAVSIAEASLSALSSAGTRQGGFLLMLHEAGERILNRPIPTRICTHIDMVRVTSEWVGFAVQEHGTQKTYRTIDSASRGFFLDWIEAVKEAISLGGEYSEGPGPAVRFRRSP